MGERERAQLVGGGLVILGLFAMVNNYFDIGDVSGPIFLLIVGAGLSLGWTRSGSLGLLIAGACTIALGLFAGLTEIAGLGDWEGPLFFLSQGAAFFAVHSFHAGKPRWARNTALGLVGFSAFVLMSEGVGDVAKFLFPAFLVVIGVYMLLGRGGKKQ